MIVASEAELRGVASPKLAQLLAVARRESGYDVCAIQALPCGDLTPKVARFAHCNERREAVSDGRANERTNSLNFTTTSCRVCMSVARITTLLAL